MNQEIFKLKLDKNFYKKGDFLNTSSKKSLEIISVPILKYNKWYWKVLSRLTYNLLFNYEASYTVKII